MAAIQHFETKQEDKNMKVLINVVGSAIVYYERGKSTWHVVFITDSCHDVQFFAPNASKSVPLAKPGIPPKITFTADGALPASRPDANIVEEFLNMSSFFMHGARSSELSNLDVVPNSTQGRSYVHMSIPYGHLRVAEYCKDEYVVEDVISTIKIPLKRVVASEFAITFDVPDPGALAMTIKDSDGTQTNTYSAKPILRMRFDNFCSTKELENDFINYYDWLLDSRSTPTRQIRFLAGKEGAHEAESEKFDGPGEKKGVQGNCDPVIVEPPPGD